MNTLKLRICPSLTVECGFYLPHNFGGECSRGTRFEDIYVQFHDLHLFAG